MSHDWLENADASWFPRVLRKLQEDFPNVADRVWSDAISENANEQTARQGDGTEPETVDSPDDGTEAGTLMNITSCEEHGYYYTALGCPGKH